MFIKLALITLFAAVAAFSQVPVIEPGVSHDLAKWRSAHYSDVRYKLNLTLEKMSPVLKGTIEIKLKALGDPVDPTKGRGMQYFHIAPIILDWRKIKGHESLSSISNVSVNGKMVEKGSRNEDAVKAFHGGDSRFAEYYEHNEHLFFSYGVESGENVIKLDFTSPILTSGSAITRYVDKEDGAEYIYSLFVPSDASTAFPVFDQPDLKARFSLKVMAPGNWNLVSNESVKYQLTLTPNSQNSKDSYGYEFAETKPISTYVFAFAAGPFERVSEPPAVAGGLTPSTTNAGKTSASDPILQPAATAGGSVLPKPRKVKTDLKEVYKRWVNTDCCGIMTKEEAKAFRAESAEPLQTSIYVRKSQAAKFQPHAAEVFRLNREGIKYLETYFDYKFPFPKYDIVLIPEFPFGGMEHAGATFLREASVIFPQEPTKNDYISRANVIFHEAAHQWFGDTVTMKWFDDLWLKEGFAEFMAYKTLEKVMPEYNAWKVFFERNKQAAYLTDSTKGTTPIYQEIANLNSAKSAYGNIVYRKAPSFLKQAEFYLGPDKFQTAVRSFLKKHEYANAGWEDLVKEFETASGQKLGDWSKRWITQRGVPLIRSRTFSTGGCITQEFRFDEKNTWGMKLRTASSNNFKDGHLLVSDLPLSPSLSEVGSWKNPLEKKLNRSLDEICAEPADVSDARFFFPNYEDYGYGIFLLDDKSRDYVLKNIQNEKDDFLRTMMWGSLWDSVREAELDPKDYVELVVKNIKTETDESTIQTLLGRVSTSMRYYMSVSEPPAVAGGLTRGTAHMGKTSASNPDLQPPATAGGSDKAAGRNDLTARLEALLIDRMQFAPTPGQRITFYRAFLGLASSDNARNALKQILAGHLKGNPKITPTAPLANDGLPNLRTKDKFDIVTRLMVLGDPDAPRLLAQLEKTETSDEARRYAYAARAGMATPENKAKYWNDFVNNKEISESWIEAAFVPFNATSHADLTLPYLERALAELPNLKRSRKIFFINGWLAAFIGGQRSEQALAIINKFLADNPSLDKDLRLKILENSDLIERAVKIRGKFKNF